MTSVFTARRRAEEFAAAVDGGARAGGALHPEIAGLMDVVAVLRTYEDVLPDPEFVGDLRGRLMTEAATVLTPENAGLALPDRSRGARERRLVAAASALVLIGGTAGMATAAQDALPGEALYPIKRGIERAEASLSLSPAGKGSDLLHQATDRLDEVRGLLVADSVGSTPQIPATLEQFSTQAAEGADLLLSSFQETRDPDAVVKVRTFTADGIAALTALADDLPPEAQDELTTAARTLRDIDAAAAALCDTCAGDLPEVQIPDLLLVRSEVDRVLETVSGRTLDNSHPVVVPKDLLEQRRRDQVTPEQGPTGSGAAGSDGQEPQAPSAGATHDEPRLPGRGSVRPDDTDSPLLPRPGESVTLRDDVTETPGGVVEDVTDGLEGVVETLLPDTDPPPLLP